MSVGTLVGSTYAGSQPEASRRHATAPAASSEGPQASGPLPPLLVDLDRTLIRSDMLHESAMAYVAGGPHRIFRLLRWMLKGRAYLKQKLAEETSIDIDLIPLNDQVAKLASDAKRDGRQVFLVTASDAYFANKIAERLPIFDGVISSDGATNLKGARKAKVVAERFPEGYDYVGDSPADVSVWRGARAIIAVEPSSATRRKINALGKPTTVIEGKSRLRALVKAARLHQWAKNALIFVPAILSGQIGNPQTVLNCGLAFLALGFVALGTYLVNDLLDLAHDRRHWSKRNRPIASGDLPIMTAAFAGVASIAIGLGIGAFVGVGVLAGLATYLVLTLAYSFHIKRVAILDVVALASLFTLRLGIGIAAAQVFASPWLLVFSMFLFTSLSVAKRYTEIQRTAAKGESAVSGRGYLVADAPLILGLGIASGTASILILVLYLIFDAFSHDFYDNPQWLWFFPVVLFLWIGRIWLISQRGELNDDPVAFALKDRQSLALGAVMAAAFVLAWAGAPL